VTLSEKKTPIPSTKQLRLNVPVNVTVAMLPDFLI
jgi:hypothetical protein